MSTAKPSLDASRLKIACKSCSLFQLCLPLGLENEDLDRLEAIIQRAKPLASGTHLFHVGDPFRSIYAIRSGSLKSYTLTNEGEERITGFHLAGELVGLDAISHNEHHCGAVSLETTSICTIPFDQVQALSHSVPNLGQQLLRLMSTEILHNQDHLSTLNKKSADQRLATLLISISERYKKRGFSEFEFNLTMSRNDISNYLGLAVETVSRLFTKFQNLSILDTQRKLVKILDMTQLKMIAGICG